jgi:hypothetical protein
MARKPSDIVQYKLRIREETRRRLEQVAKKRGVSVNYEMASRIERSFEAEALRTIDRVASDIEIHWARFGEALFQLDLQGALVRASEALVAQLSQTHDSDAIAKAGADVLKAIATIKLTAEVAARRMAGGEK